MSLPQAVRDNYLLAALAGTPAIFDGLLDGLGPADPRWDARPDPARFTLREMAAHLADWEPIFHARLQRTLTEDEPTLPDVDEEAAAIANDYAHADPIESLRRYREGRAATMELLSAVGGQVWQRSAVRPPVIGPITLEAQVVLMLSHDCYHMRQAVEWLKRAAT